MRKRFIICINNSTKEQENQFVELIKTQNVGWWHWLTNTWLISDRNGKTTASYWRDNAVHIFERENVLVFELGQDNDSWAGFGPSSDDKNMFTWIKAHWSKN
jgi:hypothetical protein